MTYHFWHFAWHFAWYHLYQIGLGLSRTMNALCGGSGDVTFSAASWELQRQGSLIGQARVWLVDLLFRKNHCLDAWAWHVERRIIWHGAV